MYVWTRFREIKNLETCIGLPHFPLSIFGIFLGNLTAIYPICLSSDIMSSKTDSFVRSSRTRTRCPPATHYSLLVIAICILYPKCNMENIENIKNIKKIMLFLMCLIFSIFSKFCHRRPISFKCSFNHVCRAKFWIYWILTVILCAYYCRANCQFWWTVTLQNVTVTYVTYVM